MWFVRSKNKEKIEKLAEASQQDFVSDAEFVVVVCTKMDELRMAYKDTAEMYARQQAGAAIENFLLKITDMELGSCWVGINVCSLTTTTVLKDVKRRDEQ